MSICQHLVLENAGSGASQPQASKHASIDPRAAECATEINRIGCEAGGRPFFGGPTRAPAEVRAREPDGDIRESGGVRREAA